ncbi:MAG TPA: enolase C-terminal domain-like protein [Cellulomonas sp.]
MSIVRMTLYGVRLPQRREHRWRTLTEGVGSYVLVELTDGDGMSGWGEATALGSWGGDHGQHDGETPEDVVHVLADLVAPAVLGLPLRHRHRVLSAAQGVVRGHPYAQTAFECAVLDLTARRAGLPVHELLGGRRRDRVPIAHSIGLMDDDAALTEAEQVVAEGVTTLKVKVGEDPDRDVRLLRALHDRLGDRAALAVDANQGWGTALQAERVLRRLLDVPLRYVEQPVEGLRQLEHLAGRVPHPVMADESMWNAFEMAELGRGGAVRLASVYTSKAGGLHRALAADAVAHAFGIGTNVNGSGETGVGNLANVHLAAAMTSLAEGCVIPVSRRREDAPTQVAGAMYTDDVLATSFSYVDGAVLVPDGPGWGIEVDRDRLAERTVWSRSVTVEDLR